MQPFRCFTHHIEKYYMKSTHLLLLSLLIFSCGKQEVEPDLQVEGVKPVYVFHDQSASIGSLPPKDFQRVGKIYKNGHRIYISDKGTGVHVIDNSNPASPVKETFISVPLNFDMLARLGVMYADSGPDLVTIDINDIQNVSEVQRIPDVYFSSEDFEGSNYFPNGYTGYFECVDPNKGYVIDWEDTQLTNPKCRR